MTAIQWIELAKERILRSKSYSRIELLEEAIKYLNEAEDEISQLMSEPSGLRARKVCDKCTGSGNTPEKRHGIYANYICDNCKGERYLYRDVSRQETLEVFKTVLKRRYVSVPLLKDGYEIINDSE